MRSNQEGTFMDLYAGKGFVEQVSRRISSGRGLIDDVLAFKNASEVPQ